MHHAVPPPAMFLRSAFAVFMSRIQPVLLASLTFALLGALGSTFMEARLAVREDAMTAELGVTWQELRTRVQEDLRVLSLLDSEELMHIVHDTPPTADIREAEHVAVVYAARVGPMVALLLLCLVAIFFIAKTYFFLLFAAERTGHTAAAELPFAVLGMAMTSVWVVVRSFLWLPFVGLLVGAYTLPRLSLAPVYYAHGGRGAFRSAAESWKRTNGLWVPMTLRLVLLILVCLLLWWMMLSVVGALALFWVKGASLLGLFGFFVLMAYFAAGLTVLAR